MRTPTLVLVLSLAACGCSTTDRAGAREFALGPNGVEIMTSARPYTFPPVFNMATTYCAKYGKAAALSSMRKTLFGSLVNTYSCEGAAGKATPQ